ncbi:SOS response-associated peptidase [Sanguibacter hominis ATCC BAA-789]|uniref:Abasic site processing protein n=1 Tax=Sanguibacter hominis ATCC BAA-789 TaxID=1312740 RepID=A0A9X5FCU6_9MICO|nr:SOS response-associated peptidase [Sanguibacter hominis]NKX91949.1 SOS response-associated peptidase [Sanguibacter hominis ATCC BAA-789]
MCGRFASFRQTQDLLDAFMIDPTLPLDPELAAWQASWNVAPTDPVRIVVERAPRGAAPGAAAERSLRLARWGLVPSWSKDPKGGARMINARSETLLEKPAFAKPMAARRCLVPTEGYYEWKAGADPKARKQPYFIRPTSEGVTAFAGLYEFWRDKDKADDDPARWLVTTTVITKAATGDMLDLHDRVPAVLQPDLWAEWLAPTTSASDARALLDVPVPDLEWYPVSAAVSTATTEGPQLIQPVS